MVLGSAVAEEPPARVPSTQRGDLVGARRWELPDVAGDFEVPPAGGANVLDALGDRAVTGGPGREHELVAADLLQRAELRHEGAHGPPPGREGPTPGGG